MGREGSPVPTGRDDPEGRDIQPIAQLSPARTDVTVRGRVLRVGRRPLPGGELITEGHVRDASGDIPFIAWSGCIPAAGERVRISGARTGTWHGRLQLELDADADVCRLESSGAGVEVPAPVGLHALAVGDRAISIGATVLAATAKTVEPRGDPTRVVGGTLGDRAIRLPFIDWTGRDRLSSGTAVRIRNAYVTEHRGIPSVNLSTRSRVETVATGLEPPTRLPSRSIRTAMACGSSLDVTVRGSIIRLLEGSGLIQRCPRCGRALAEDRCRRHGPVVPTDDFRTKAVLDDGRGTVTLVLGTDITASIYGAGVEEARKETKGRMDAPVSDRIEQAIVGRSFQVCGRLCLDEDDARLTADRFTPVGTRAKHRGRRLLEGLQA